MRWQGSSRCPQPTQTPTPSQHPAGLRRPVQRQGRKELNQDFHGALIPAEPLLSTKGIAIALADGISSSAVSQVASESAVRGFLDDYYCTSDAWS